MRRLAAALAALITALSAFAAIALPAGAAAPACAPPYLPVFAFRSVSGSGTPSEVPPEEGPSLAVPLPQLDTDGDGAVDGAVLEAGRLVIDRSTGRLELVAAEGVRTFRPLGDLDGDGRTDLGLEVGSQPTPVVVVPGATPDGRHDALDVGVRVAGDLQPTTSVGDQDRDGADDVGVFDPALNPEGRITGVTTVVSGRSVLAPGPGGTLEQLPPSLVAVRGRVAGVLQLVEGGPPTLVDYLIVERGAETPLVAELTVHLDPPVTLRTARVGAPELDLYQFNTTVDGYRTPSGHRIVRVSGADRSGGQVLLWDLDDLCAQPTPVAAPAAPAPAAAPAAPPPAPAPASARPDQLPRTGLDPAVLAGAGAALVGVGTLLVRRRQAGSSDS